MKRLLQFGFLLLATSLQFNFLYAQKALPAVTKISGHGEINFAELAKKELLNPPVQGPLINKEEKEENQRGIPRYLKVPANTKVTNITAPFSTKFLLESPQATSPAPVKSFNGLLDNGLVIPPDVNGAAGPSSLFETLNSQYRIFNKTGGTISTLSLNSFWSGLNTVGSPYSDPHIVYDANLGKWLACTIANLTNGHYGVFVAVSQTSDPSGSWYEYSIDTGPSSTLPDYPLLGYNKNWIVITTNDFLNLVFNRSRIIVLNKADAAAGTLGTANTFFDNALFTISPAETMDAAEENEYMLNNYNGNSGGSGFVKICTISGTVAAPVYTSGALIGVNKPWSETTVDAPQKGSTRLINTNSTKMRTVVVRNGFIWASHTIYLPAAAPTRSSVDFWQINPVSNAIVQYGRVDDATGAYSIAFPSLAVTASNDVLMGFSAFGSTIYATAAYAYRRSTDAVNTFRYPYVYKNGLASYYKTFGGTRNRWGDFSATCIDPADGSFWTLQEFANTPANKWGTVWANVLAAAAPDGLLNYTTTNTNSGNNNISIDPNPSRGKFLINYNAAKQSNISVSILNVQGIMIYKTNASVIEGINQINIQLQNIINGSYTVVFTDGNDIKTVPLIIEK